MVARVAAPRMIDALHELVDESEALCVHAPRPADVRRLRALAARVHEAVAAADREAAAAFDPARLSAHVDELLARLDDEHRAGLLAELEAAAVVDGEVGRGEAEILEEVRRALGQ